jgi:hypothetical protein
MHYINCQVNYTNSSLEALLSTSSRREKVVMHYIYSYIYQRKTRGRKLNHISKIYLYAENQVTDRMAILPY